MTQYRVKNWERFQHYKDRNPPWIKLHFEILASKDWVMLADASKLFMVVCMMVASRNEGVIPADPNYFKRVAYLDKLPNFKPLLDCGFLEILQADASGCKQELADARPETEAYSTETDKKDISPKIYSDQFEEFWKAWPSERRCEKPKAYVQWKIAIKKTTPEAILNALTSYVETKEAKDGFAPYPAKWLKGERWNEDLTAPQKTTVSDYKKAEIYAWKREKGLPLMTEERSFLEAWESTHGNIQQGAIQ